MYWSEAFDQKVRSDRVCTLNCVFSNKIVHVLLFVPSVHLLRIILKMLFHLKFCFTLYYIILNSNYLIYLIQIYLEGRLSRYVGVLISLSHKCFTLPMECCKTKYLFNIFCIQQLFQKIWEYNKWTVVFKMYTRNKEGFRTQKREYV